MVENRGFSWEDFKTGLWAVAKSAIIAMIVALLVHLGVPAPEAGEFEVSPQGITHLSALATIGNADVGGSLTVTGASQLTGNVTASGTLAVTGASTLTGTVTASNDVSIGGTLSASGAASLSTLSTSGAASLGSLAITNAGTVGSFWNVSAGSTVACSDGGVITMTATYQPLSATGTVTPALSTTATGVTTGTLLCLVNTSANTINLADSGTARLAGAWAAGQDDAMWLVFDGTNWVEVSRSDN
jgi:fibronectin-binding autotransporter adhesin